MKIKKEYTLLYDDQISIVQTMPDGTQREVAPISDTAAMAWEGIAKGVDRKRLVDAIVNEFSGADAATVERDLDGLIAQLRELVYIED